MEKYATSIATTTTIITTTTITTMTPTTPPVVSRPLTPAAVTVGCSGEVFGVAMELLLLCGPAVGTKVINRSMVLVVVMEHVDQDLCSMPYSLDGRGPGVRSYTCQLLELHL